MVTMSQIAEHLGVSRATVSFVINGRDDEKTRISPEVRRRVLEAAEQMGYRTNELARSVASGRTRIISYLVHNPNYEPYWRTLLGAIEEAEANGYAVKVLSTTQETIADRVRQCIEMRVAGIVVRHDEQSGLDHAHEEAARYRIPLVAVDEATPQPLNLRIMADDAHGCHLAMEHLCALGHRRIAFLSMLGDLPGGKAGGVIAVREQAYLDEMTARGLPVPPEYVVRIPGDQFSWQQSEGIVVAIQRVLDAPQRPTAILCWVDQLAMLAVRACHEYGLRVPQDVSVVGFSDFALTELCNPPLTTVMSPWTEMGRASVRHLLGCNPEELDTAPRVEAVLPSFVVRRSTAAPAT